MSADRFLVERDAEVRRQAFEDAAAFLEAIGDRLAADVVREMKYAPYEFEVGGEK